MTSSYKKKKKKRIEIKCEPCVKTNFVFKTLKPGNEQLMKSFMFSFFSGACYGW